MLPRLVPYAANCAVARALVLLRLYVGVATEVATRCKAGKVEIELLNGNRERNISVVLDSVLLLMERSSLDRK
jgi:hypothetical protein